MLCGVTFGEWAMDYGVQRLADAVGVHRNTVTGWAQGGTPKVKHWPLLNKLSGGRFFMTEQQLEGLREVGKG